MKTIKLLFLLFLIIVFLAGLYWIFNSNIKSTHNNSENKKMIESMENGDSGCPDMLIKKGNKLLLLNSKKPVNDTNPIPFNNLDEYIYYLEAQRKLGNNCPVLFLQEETNTQGEDVYRIRPSPFDQQGGLPTTVPPTSNPPTTAPVPKNRNSNPSIAPRYTSVPNALTDINKLNPYPPLSISDTTKYYYPPATEITNINNTEINRQTEPSRIAVNVVDAGRENAPYNAGNYASFDPYGQFVGVYTNLDEIHYSTEKNNSSDNPMDGNWGGVEYTQRMIDTGKYQDNNITKPLLYQPKTAFMPNDPTRPQPKDVI